VPHFGPTAAGAGMRCILFGTSALFNCIVEQDSLDQAMVLALTQQGIKRLSSNMSGFLSRIHKFSLDSTIIIFPPDTFD
jgi:hypothetical protein